MCCQANWFINTVISDFSQFQCKDEFLVFLLKVHVNAPVFEGEDLRNLGEIGIIAAEKTRSVNIGFYESLNLLERYIKQ